MNKYAIYERVINTLGEMYSRVKGSPSCSDGRKVVILNEFIRIGVTEKMRADDKPKREELAL